MLRADCPRCGTIELPFADVRLVFDPQSAVNSGTVEFACPKCGRPTSQTVGDRAIRLLTGADVHMVLAPPVPQVAPAGDDGDRPS